MARVLVLYYSMYGHTETMARSVAEGQWVALQECQRHTSQGSEIQRVGADDRIGEYVSVRR
jgi:flavodoxin